MKKLIATALLITLAALATNENVQLIRTIAPDNENNVKVFKFQDGEADCYVATKSNYSPAISCIKR